MILGFLCNASSDVSYYGCPAMSDNVVFEGQLCSYIMAQ